MTSRRALGLTTRAQMTKNATRHARLKLLAAAHASRMLDDPVLAADARTTMADCHAALEALREDA